MNHDLRTQQRPSLTFLIAVSCCPSLGSSHTIPRCPISRLTTSGPTPTCLNPMPRAPRFRHSSLSPPACACASVTAPFWRHACAPCRPAPNPGPPGPPASDHAPNAAAFGGHPQPLSATPSPDPPAHTAPLAAMCPSPRPRRSRPLKAQHTAPRLPGRVQR